MDTNHGVYWVIVPCQNIECHGQKLDQLDSNCPIEKLEAIDDLGYQFIGWKNNNLYTQQPCLCDT